MPDDGDEDVSFSDAEFPEWLTSGCLPVVVVAALVGVACLVWWA